MEKDYSLLRPFDMEEAKNGALIFEKGTEDEKGKFVVGPSTLGEYVFSFPATGYVVYKDLSKDLVMAPLVWVEGRPVYVGDILYINDIAKFDQVTGVVSTEDREGYLTMLNSGSCLADNRNGNLSWNKPKVKKRGWMNVYPGSMGRCVHLTKEAADEASGAISRTACIEVHWEE